MTKIRTSFALSQEALDLIKKIAEKKGISMAAVLELTIRESAKKEGIK